MRVVIEIPNKIYLEIKGDYLSLDGKKAVCEGIKNGIPLPNGHDCISRADMLDAVGHGTTYTSEEVQNIVNSLPPVIPKMRRKDD